MFKLSVEALSYERTDWNDLQKEVGVTETSRIDALESKAIFNQVNVKDYGAVGDGVTDDTEAVQNAIDSGLKIEIPKDEIFLVENLTSNGNVFFGGGTLKLKAQPSLTFYPIINIIGGKVKFEDIIFDGNRDNQPEDGFSDSFDTGLNNTGKSNRCGILIDGNVVDVDGLTVEGCKFINFYGSPIATRGISNIRILNNDFEDCNFGLYFYVKTATIGENLWVIGNKFNNIFSGDETVNANCATISAYNNVFFIANKGHNCERNLVKFENSNYIECSYNILDTNRIDNFNGLQLQGTCSFVNMSYNILKDIGCGIKCEGGTFTNINITHNQIENTTGSVTGDGLTASNFTDSRISENIFRGVARIGMYIIDPTNVIVENNILIGSGSSIGIYSKANTKNADGLFIKGNKVSNFEQTSSSGVLSFTRNSTYSFANVEIIDNRVIAGASTYRGIYFTTSNIITTGKMLNNYVLGTIEHYSTNLITLNNDASRCIGSAIEGNLTVVLDAVPSSGTHYVGEIVKIRGAGAGDYQYYKCITTGTPGTWKGYGLIEE